MVLFCPVCGEGVKKQELWQEWHDSSVLQNVVSEGDMSREMARKLPHVLCPHCGGGLVGCRGVEGGESGEGGEGGGMEPFERFTQS